MPEQPSHAPITNLERDKLVAYEFEGPDQARLIRWLPVTYDQVSQCGSYYFQMLPGAYTTPHVHPGYEEFYVLEGEAIESDGTVIRAGDFISFPPGSYHSTRTDKGCLMLVFEWRALPASSG